MSNVSHCKVSVTIRKFAEAGLIEPGYRWIRILDPGGIVQLIDHAIRRVDPDHHALGVGA